MGGYLRIVADQRRLQTAILFRAEIERLFAGWREELATRRKFVPAARHYAAARREADVGLRVNEIRMLDVDDVRWELGRFGQAERPPRQGSTTPRPQAAAGAAGQRR